MTVMDQTVSVIDEVWSITIGSFEFKGVQFSFRSIAMDKIYWMPNKWRNAERQRANCEDESPEDPTVQGCLTYKKTHPPRTLP